MELGSDRIFVFSRYAPVPGPRGDKARAADALSLRLIVNLHHWAASGP